MRLLFAPIVLTLRTESNQKVAVLWAFLKTNNSSRVAVELDLMWVVLQAISLPLASQSTQYLLSSSFSKFDKTAWNFSCWAFCFSLSVLEDIFPGVLFVQ